MLKEIGTILPIEFRRGRGKDKRKRKKRTPLTYKIADKAEDALIKANNSKFVRSLDKKDRQKKRRRNLISTAVGATTLPIAAALMNKRAGRHPLSGALWSGVTGAFLGSQVADIRNGYYGKWKKKK